MAKKKAAAAIETHEKEEEESCESCEEEEEEEEIQLALDDNGRVGYEGKITYGVRTFASALTVTSGNGGFAGLMQDCELAFTARSKKGYSSGKTFWIASNETPRNALEKLAQSIFAFHAKHASYDPSISGAEWWTLIMDTTDDVGFHYDMDYGLEPMGVNCTPHLGTVTYLCDEGAPTFILEQSAPTFTTDPYDGVAKGGIMSFPSLGKHVSFDGKYLHGAPEELRLKQDVDEGKNQSKRARGASGSSGAEDKKNKKKRITFLVNIWLNHVPITAQRFPSDQIVVSNVDNVLFEPSKKEDSPYDIRVTEKTNNHEYNWRVAIEGKKRTVRAVLPLEDIHAAVRQGHKALHLIFNRNTHATLS